MITSKEKNQVDSIFLYNNVKKRQKVTTPTCLSKTDSVKKAIKKIIIEINIIKFL
jgi:hypothetical protein